MYKYILFSVLLGCLLVGLFAEDRDLNEYYRYPFSVNIEYQSLNPFADYSSTHEIFEISSTVRVPLQSDPRLQPLGKIFVSDYDYQGSDDPDKWDHIHVGLGGGISFLHRFEKNFEVGAEVLAGYSASYFPNLDPDGEMAGQHNLFLEAGGRINLVPDYHFSLSFHPSLRYQVALGSLDSYNGFSLGLGFSGSYRFGDDPDENRGLIRSLRLTGLEMPPLFASMNSYYSKNSFTSVTVTNSEKYMVENLDVSFYQAGYMDNPTLSASIERLAPGESATVDLYATFNKEVFQLEGISPMNGEILMTYETRGNSVEQKQSVSYELYDKSSVTWDDARKIASLITPSDSALRNFASFIRQSSKESTLENYSDSLQYAMQVYYALTGIGCLYQVDPTMPFSQAQNDPFIVDSVSLPRDTLSRITGDCDDFTVLFNSLMEAGGYASGFITTPGHIYSIFDTGLSSRDFKLIHPDRSKTLVIDGNIWIPVEITLIGKAGFMEAWETGASEWNAQENHPENRQLYLTRDSQRIFRPVSLTEKDLGLQYGSPDFIEKSFRDDLYGLTGRILQEMESRAYDANNTSAFNSLGMTLVRFGRHDQARLAFQEALDLKPDNISAQVNLGNLQYIAGNYQDALRIYGEAYAQLEDSGKTSGRQASMVLINLSKANQKLDMIDIADQSLMMAKKADSQTYELFASIDVSGARASEALSPADEILFMEATDE